MRLLGREPHFSERSKIKLYGRGDSGLAFFPYSTPPGAIAYCIPLFLMQGTKTDMSAFGIKAAADIRKSR